MNASTPIATKDLSEDFFAELVARYGQQAPNLLQVWQSESQIFANAHNPHGDASGICQLMPATAKGLGWDPADCDGTPGTPTHPLAKYRALTAAQQLSPWVGRYYAPWQRVCDSPELWYLATFLPAYLERPADELVDSLVIAAKLGPLGWAYEANMTFDPDRTGKITLGDLGAAIVRNCHGARYEEAATRLAAALGNEPPAPLPAPAKFDLTTVFGLEEALRQLVTRKGGPYYQGALDGDSGPLLRGAIAAFQADRHLWVDSIPGPDTRAALAAALGTG